MGIMEGHSTEEIKEKFQDVRFFVVVSFAFLLSQPFFFSFICPDLRLRHPCQLEDLARHPGYQLQTHADPV